MERSFYRRTFDTKDAMFDKLSFSIKSGHYLYTNKSRENRDNFIKHLGQYDPKKHGRKLDLDEIKRISGWIFNSSERKKRVQVRQQKTKNLPNGMELNKPHFSGAYTLHHISSDKSQNYNSRLPNVPDYFVNFHVDTNVTRYMLDHITAMRAERRASYNYRLRKSNNDSPWEDHSVLTQSNREKPDPHREYSYDGNDNWIPFFYKEGRIVPFKREKLLPDEEHISLTESTYLPLIDQALTKEFKRAAEGAEIRYSQDPSSYVLSHVEVYWDIYHKNPIRAVKEIKELIKGYSCYKPNSKSYLIPPSNDPEEAGELNSIRISLVLASGVKLVIYAKSNKRIRFEIRFAFGTTDEKESGKDRKSANASHIFPKNKDTRDRQSDPQNSGGYSSPSIELLSHKLDRLKEYASEQLSKVFDYLYEKDTFTEPENSHSLHTFIGDFYKVVGDIRLADDLLNLLAEEEHIVSSKEFGKACDKLEKANILKKHKSGGTRNVFQIDPRYYQALRLYAGREATPLNRATIVPEEENAHRNAP